MAHASGKNTNLWSNAWPYIGDMKTCTTASPCKNKQQFGKHILTAQAGPSSNGTQGSGGGKHSQEIPQALVKKLLTHISLVTSAREDDNAQRLYAAHIGDLIRSEPLDSKAFLALANDMGGAATLLHRRLGHAHGAVIKYLVDSGVPLGLKGLSSTMSTTGLHDLCGPGCR